MDKAQETRLDAMRRMQRFVTRNGGSLGAMCRSRARMELDELLSKIRKHAAMQHDAEEASRRWTRRRDKLRRDVLRRHLPPIAAIVRARLADLPTLPTLLMLHKRVDDRTLISLATAVLDGLAPFSKVLVEEQLPPSYLTELRGSIAALEQALAERESCRIDRTAATAGLMDDFRRAGDITRVLDALVVRQLRGKPKLLADWLAAKRINGKPRRALEPRVGPSRRQDARAGSSTSRVSTTPYKEAG